MSVNNEIDNNNNNNKKEITVIEVTPETKQQQGEPTMNEIMEVTPETKQQQGEPTMNEIMEVTPETEEQQGEPTMNEINDLFPMQPENEVASFILKNDSIVNFTIGNKAVETMSAFEIVDELQQLQEVKNFLDDCIRTESFKSLDINLKNHQKVNYRVAALYNHEVVDRWDKFGYYVYAIESRHTKMGVWHFAIEARLMPNSNESGWFIEYNRIANYTPVPSRGTEYEYRPVGKQNVKNVLIKTHRQKYKQIVIVSETKNGVRLLVKNTKTKAVYWGQTISTVKGNNNLFAIGLSKVNYFIMGQLEEMYAAKDVIRLTESYPVFIAKKNGESTQLHEFTQRDLYYFSEAKNLKDVFNKAYGKTANNGLTKNAFGGAQALEHFEELQAAVVIIRMLKPFPREFFDNIKLKWVIRKKPANVTSVTDIPEDDDISSEDWYENQVREIEPPYSIDRTIHPVVRLGNDTINTYKIFFNYFGINSKMIQETQDVINSGYMPPHGIIADAITALKMIPSGSNRKAVINQIKRQKLTYEEIHDYVVNEARKYVGAIKKTPNTPVINSFHKQEIIPGVVFVAPQTTEDLQQWGNEQNNCIGTNYSDRVAERQTFIFGFMNKQTQEWIGHARISYHNNQMTINEFLASYNRVIDKEIAMPIINWMNKNLSTKTKQKEKTNE